MKRRNLLKALGLAGAACVSAPTLGRLGLPGIGGLLGGRAAAQTQKRVIIIRTLFDLRDASRTNLSQDLAPLAPWSDRLLVVNGLDTKGDGSEYHNGKQIRFATACTPTDRTGQSYGGGAFDGKSVDVVAGQHLQSVQGSRTANLILGAYPYSDSSLHTTFESISFASRLQYVRPEYDLAAVGRDIHAYAGACEDTGPSVDVAGLQQEIRVLEAVMADLSRSRGRASAEIAAQVEALEAQYAAIRADHERAIASDVPCMPLRSSPLAYSYVRHEAIPEIFDTRLREMNFLAALALKTNYTSAVTLNYNFSGHGQPGIPAYHDYTHPGGFSRPPNGAELVTLDVLSSFQVNMFAHLLRELADLGILNDTLVVYSPHERPTHNHADVPVIAFNSGAAGQRTSGLQVPDMCRDILQWAGVPGADNFGGERSRGGVLV